VPVDDKHGSIGIDALPNVCCNQMVQLGDNIKVARLRRKIRQEDMAKRVAIA
jgi:hypothetical protein